MGLPSCLFPSVYPKNPAHIFFLHNMSAHMQLAFPSVFPKNPAHILFLHNMSAHMQHAFF